MIGRNVSGFLREWGAEVALRDFRLEGDEHVDARDPESLARALGGHEPGRDERGDRDLVALVHLLGLVLVRVLAVPLRSELKAV